MANPNDFANSMNYGATQPTFGSQFSMPGLVDNNAGNFGGVNPSNYGLNFGASNGAYGAGSGSSAGAGFNFGNSGASNLPVMQSQYNMPVPGTPNAAGGGVQMPTVENGFKTAFLGKMNDKTGQRGPSGVMTGVQALSGLGSLYFGMKQYGLARDSFRENKRQFEMNFNAQRQTLNTQMQDRQNARVASNPNYQDTASYMAQNSIKP